SMICHWLKDYEKDGESAFDLKSYRKGNLFAALHTSKTLTETEGLRLQLSKLEIENERLKKGYQVKGVGVNKEFVSLKDVNTR
ncbi:MAG: transposase, partial [Anaerovorax sp.]